MQLQPKLKTKTPGAQITHCHQRLGENSRRGASQTACSLNSKQPVLTHIYDMLVWEVGSSTEQTRIPASERTPAVPTSSAGTMLPALNSGPRLLQKANGTTEPVTVGLHPQAAVQGQRVCSKPGKPSLQLLTLPSLQFVGPGQTNNAVSQAHILGRLGGRFFKMDRGNKILI